MRIFKTNDELQELKARLIHEFTEYQSNSNLDKYKELLGEFLSILQHDNVFPTIENGSDSTLYHQINEDNTLDTYYSLLKQTENYVKQQGVYSKKQSILANDFNKNVVEIIECFFMIIYVHCCEMWILKSKNNDKEDAQSFLRYAKNIGKHIKHLSTVERINAILGYHYFSFQKYYENQINFSQKIDKLSNFLKDIDIHKEYIETHYSNIDKCRNDINDIEKKLADQRQEFNFIGLADAFQKMKDDKQNELKSEQRYNIFLRVLIAILLSLKLSYAIFGNFSGFDAKFAFISLSSIFLIAVLIYFFRISLINIKSIKSQILQLDLRLSLCQFIHNYSTESKDMRDNMKNSLDRFESIIFSPIVANEEQIPTTFDNLDQFIKMMNIANGGKFE